MSDRLTPSQQLKMRVYRARKNLSLSEVAELLGASPSAVGQWECGARAPRGLYRDALAKLIPELGL